MSDTTELKEKLDTLLGSSEYFDKTDHGWMINEELAESYDGSARNQTGRRYAYRADNDKIKEAMFATAPYNGGKDMWLKGEHLENIADFREYIKQSYGVNI